MTRRALRLLGILMASMTFGFIAVSSGGVVLQAGAYRCCQECNAAEAGCKAACDAQTHNYAVDDALSGCYSECDSDPEVYDCFTSCRDCEITPAGPCYSWDADHGTQYPSYTTYHILNWATFGSGICPF